jgi:hypothetical protein
MDIPMAYPIVFPDIIPPRVEPDCIGFFEK